LYNDSFDLLFRNDLLNKPSIITEKIRDGEHSMIVSFIADLRDKEEV
jgi:hypothetical protein